MRITVFVVFCLGLNNIFTHASSGTPTQLTSTFNCEELSSHIQNLKDSTKSKKEKFSCILNLLKGALSEELENCECPEIIEDIIIYPEDVIEGKTNDTYQIILSKEKECEKSYAENTFSQKIAKTIKENTKDCINDTKNLEVPTMIPIFKPRPPPRNDFYPARPRPIPVSPQAVFTNSNHLSNAPKFTIPCQRAADILDMSNLAPPIEVTEKHETIHPNLKLPAPISVSGNEIPTKVFVHNANSEESVSIMFKPKAISLIQLYGNLLKKITITVLVPYHMSKIGQQ